MAIYIPHLRCLITYYYPYYITPYSSYITVLPTQPLKLYNTGQWAPLPNLIADVLQKRTYPTVKPEIRCVNL